MEALRIITEEHQNLWRIASTIDLVADEIDGGSKVVFELVDNKVLERKLKAAEIEPSTDTAEV